ncbi:MAG TPA: type II secretion system F family protein [Planctomycetaceae bacterium]|nr:type II secretion system F family protein [Planctomycetaceae bacterium]
MNWQSLTMVTWDSWTAQVCAFLAVSGLTYLAFHAIWSRDRRVDDRLFDLSSDLPLAQISSARSDPAASSMRSKVARLAAQLLPNDQRERTQLQARLMQAGIYAPWAPTVFLTMRLVLIAVPMFVALFLGALGVGQLQRIFLCGAVAGGIGALLPNFWLSRRRTRRHSTLMKSLPYFLDLMVTCVQAGLSINAALQRVTEELALAHPVLAGEMGIVERQIELGASPDLALRNFAERSDLAPISTLATLVEQTRRFGTSISDALRTHAETIREQREQRAEELAQKAAVKILFPTLLLIFPAIFIVLVGPAAVQIVQTFSTPHATASESK